MDAFLKKYGMTASVVSDYERLQALDGEATPDEIRQALDVMVPVAPGIPLVRIGKSTDGGYLVPEDLDGIEACFSPGTNNFKDFEDYLTQNFGIKAFMCDYSSDVHRLRTPLIPNMQVFEKKWLDVEDRDDSVRLDTWIKQHAPGTGDLLLQMDIEGAEYRNLAGVSDDTLRRFRIIVIEIHDLHSLSRAQFVKGVFMPAMRRLGQFFQCVHAHANNCCGQVTLSVARVPRVVELTFLRKDRVRAATANSVVIPHPLDVLNVPAKPPLPVRTLARQGGRAAISRQCS